ncbi:hypothetical protein LguiA_021529 [Lonicera macranthoides]
MVVPYKSKVFGGLERNTRIFEDKSCKAGEVWFKIKLLASFWAISSNLFGSLSISNLCGNWNAAIQ